MSKSKCFYGFTMFTHYYYFVISMMMIIIKFFIHSFIWANHKPILIIILLQNFQRMQFIRDALLFNTFSNNNKPETFHISYYSFSLFILVMVISMWFLFFWVPGEDLYSLNNNTSVVFTMFNVFVFYLFKKMKWNEFFLPLFLLPKIQYKCPNWDNFRFYY